MKLVFWLVGVAAALFIVGGVGTIAAFVAHADGARPWFMWTFLAGLVPTMVFLGISLGIGIYHLYLYRFANRTPSGWLSSDDKTNDLGEHAPPNPQRTNPDSPFGLNGE